MPIQYARSLAGHDRTPTANHHLGVALAFVAGALGFKHLGYLSTVPLAALLGLLAIVPAVDEAIRLYTQRS